MWVTDTLVKALTSDSGLDWETAVNLYRIDDQLNANLMSITPVGGKSTFISYDTEMWAFQTANSSKFFCYIAITPNANQLPSHSGVSFLDEYEKQTVSLGSMEKMCSRAQPG
jgi:hypothetical protein